MLRHILKNSKRLQAFLWALHLELYVPQRRHITNVMDALLVCEDAKTLSALHRQIIDPPSDVYALCDCFRQSPWQGATIRQQTKPYLVQRILNWAKTTSQEPVIYLSLDDSLTEKDKATTHLEAVDWHIDHTQSTPTKKIYKNGLVHVHLHMEIGGQGITVDWRLYLRERTVRTLNRTRAQGKRLSFKSKYRLSREMLMDMAPLLPKDYTVYVLFDSWYASAKLIKLCKRLGWDVICAIKSNRTLDGIQLRNLLRTLRHQPYTRVVLKADSRKPTTYLVRSREGRISKVPFEVCALMSKRHYRDHHPAYFLTTDLSLSPQEALEGYEHRWPVEVDNFYLKTRLGLGDFRVHSVEATERWMALVFLTLSYLQLRLMEDRGPTTQTLSDVIRTHRAEHVQVVFRAACEMTQDTQDINGVIQRFFYDAA